MSSMHFMTADPKEDPGPDYGFELITGYVYLTPHDGAVPLYRWVESKSNLHFYTLDPNGERAPELGYVEEKNRSPACYVLPSGAPAGVPVYRYYWPAGGDHLYTQDEKGEKGPPDYLPEGVAFYVYAKQEEGTVPLRRYVAGSQLYCYLWTKNGVFQNNHQIRAANAASAEIAAQAYVSEILKIYGLGSIDAYSIKNLRLGGC